MTHLMALICIVLGIALHMFFTNMYEWGNIGFKTRVVATIILVCAMAGTLQVIYTGGTFL